MLQLRSLFRKEKGSSLTLLVVALPMLLSLLGLVVDAGLYGLQVVRLSSAADSAALAAASAVDVQHYQETGAIRLDQNRARERALKFVAANYDGAVSTTVTFPHGQPGRVSVHLEAQTPTVFMKLFGIDEAPLKAKSEAQAG